METETFVEDRRNYASVPLCFLPRLGQGFGTKRYYVSKTENFQASQLSQPAALDASVRAPSDLHAIWLSQTIACRSGGASRGLYPLFDTL